MTMTMFEKLQLSFVLGALSILLLWFIAHVDIAGAKDVCYAPYGTEVTPEYEVTNVMVTAYVFDTAEELSADVGEKVASYSVCETLVEENVAWCEVWIVQPTNVLGDPAMDGIGHEVGHGIWGDFHPGGKSND